MAFMDDKKKEIERQIEQLTCFLKASYAGFTHDIKIVWKYGGEADRAGHKNEQSTIDYWRRDYGKHEEITIGVGDAYYGSDTLAHMLYEGAYHMRERLHDKLSEMATGKTRAEIKREAEEAAKERKERAELDRLKAKYENGTMTAPTVAQPPAVT
jgi:hypothetical protein